MIDFFKYYTEIPKEMTFKNFGMAHNISLLIILIFIILGISFIRKIDRKKCKFIIKVLAVCVPVLELSHTVWLYNCGLTDWQKLLPLHICAMNMILIPIAIFSKNLLIREYVFAFSIVGGIFGVVLPSGVSGSYPIIHYQTIQTFIYHSLLIFIPIAQIAIDDFMPDIKNIYKVHILFIVLAILVGIFDYTFDENYMFIKYPPDVELAKYIFNNLGIVVYTIVFIIVCTFGSILMYLPLELYKKKIKKINEVKD